MMQDFTIDVKQIQELLSQAVKILSMGNSVVLHKHKGLLWQYLDKKYHGLLKPTNLQSSNRQGSFRGHGNWGYGGPDR